MAKGQQRGNREAKKPKKDKLKPPVVSSTPTPAVPVQPKGFEAKKK